MHKFARIRLPSPIPALDKVYDYKVPDSLNNLKFGQLVKVPFGKDRALKVGIIVGLESESSHTGELLNIESVVSDYPLLTNQQLELIENVSRRFLGSASELISSVIPKRMIRAEKAFSVGLGEKTKPVAPVNAKRVLLETSWERINDIPDWAVHFAKVAMENFNREQSTIIALPDFRDLEVMQLALNGANNSAVVNYFGSAFSASENYTSYLHSISVPGIHVGLRSAVFLPANQLGAILVLDDGDDSHVEPSSPYWNSRDVALIRQSLENCDLVFASHSPSSETVRLVALGYLDQQSNASFKPLVRITDNRTRLDDETYGFIAKCISDGLPVLIQVANLGFATSIACRRCNEIRTCDCGSRIWIDPQKRFRCRVCKSSGALPPCRCGATDIKILRTGSASVTEWLRKALANANVIHSSAEERITRIERGPNLVIATPGSEPEVPGGYSCVVIADAYSMVGAPRLRALERSLLFWSNAVAKVAKTGLVIFVGLTGELANSIKELDFYGAMQADYKERVELGLPPTTRIVSVTSGNKTDIALLRDGITQAMAELIRPVPVADELALAFCFKYRDSDVVSETLRRLVTEVSARSKNKLPGERVFRVRMDDTNAI